MLRPSASEAETDLPFGEHLRHIGIDEATGGVRSWQTPSMQPYIGCGAPKTPTHTGAHPSPARGGGEDSDGISGLV